MSYPYSLHEDFLILFLFSSISVSELSESIIMTVLSYDTFGYLYLYKNGLIIAYLFLLEHSHYFIRPNTFQFIWDIFLLIIKFKYYIVDRLIRYSIICLIYV